MVPVVRVTLLVTCVVDLFEPDVGTATVRVLRAAGCDVTCAADQTCCGQPAWNAGFAAEAAAVAATTLAALEAELAAGAEAVVVPAGSCAAMVRVFWPELFETVGDHAAAARARAVGAKTFELTEFLAVHLDALPALELGRPIAMAWHQCCHHLRELRGDEAATAVLDRIGACERIDWPAADRCCGFGGLFSFKLPEVSVAMADDKLASLDGLGADLVAGTDSSCLVHLRGRAAAEGRPILTKHVAEVLAAALDDAP
jgi:L-lactate dehydrogenase complex protein LldE